MRKKFTEWTTGQKIAGVFLTLFIVVAVTLFGISHANTVEEYDYSFVLAQAAGVEEEDQSPDSTLVTQTQDQAPANKTVQTRRNAATTEVEMEANGEGQTELEAGNNAGAGNEAENSVDPGMETNAEINTEAQVTVAPVATAPETVTAPVPETVTAPTPTATAVTPAPENSEGEEVENSVEDEEGTSSTESEESPEEVQEPIEKTLAELRAEALVQAKTIAEMPVSTGFSAKWNIVEAMISVCVGTPPGSNCGPLGFLWNDLKDFVPVQFMSGETKKEMIANLVASESFVEVSADANSLFPGDLVFLEDGELALMSLGQFSTGDNLFVCYGMRQDCTVLFCTDSEDECLESLVASEQSIANIVTVLNGGEDTRIDRTVLETATVLRPKNNPCVGYSAEELLKELLPSAVRYAHNYLNK